jgi:ribosomal protein L37AE/L43A
MAIPHTCPTCKGARRTRRPPSATDIWDPCPTCDGTGVVWEPGVTHVYSPPLSLLDKLPRKPAPR